MKYLIAFVLLLHASRLVAQHGQIPTTSEFVVGGAVKKVMKYQVRDLMAMKQDNLGDVIMHSHRTDTAHEVKGILLKTIVDSANVTAEKPKAYNEMVIVLTASDGYKSVYSGNELFNSDIGNHVYLLTALNGKTLDQLDDRIAVVSFSDIFAGRRHLKGLTKIEVKKVD